MVRDIEPGAGWFGDYTQRESIAVSTCDNPPSSATFNPYPITCDVNAPCKDLPLVSAHVGNNAYSTNVTARPGDEIWVRVYIHNCAADNLGDQTTAHNVRAQIRLNGSNTANPSIYVKALAEETSKDA